MKSFDKTFSKVFALRRAFAGRRPQTAKCLYQRFFFLAFSLRLYRQRKSGKRSEVTLFGGLYERQQRFFFETTGPKKKLCKKKCRFLGEFRRLRTARSATRRFTRAAF
ncbi:MAG: hypothetical protein IKT56_03255 [Clostridia bacterium]|nr:hypothetical protein [Clostridia bacterium]